MFNIFICLCLYLYTHKKHKDSLEPRILLLMILLELGVAAQIIQQTAKNGSFCEKLFTENDFGSFSQFLFYDYGVNASEAVEKIATAQNIITNAACVI